MQTEWAILRSYTCRIRSITKKNAVRLNRKSQEILANPPTREPLFPNLRHLCCEFADDVMPFLHLPFPSLLSLDLQLLDTSKFRFCLESFSAFSPNLSRLHIHPRMPRTVKKFDFNCISRWPNLQTLICRQFPLDVDALSHLARMSSLTRLDFELSTTSLNFDTIFPLTNLRSISLRSKSLALVQRLPFLIRLPIIVDFAIVINETPSKEEFPSFLACVQTSHTVQGLQLYQSRWAPISSSRDRDGSLLGLEDLRPCMALSNLRRINLNVKWSIGLTDCDLLTLVSAWPHLEKLYINEHWGWNTPGGITPNGLLQLLQTCRLLSHVALAIDTRGFTGLPHSLASLGLTLPPTFFINVVDSSIEADAVPAMTAFFSGFAPCLFFVWLLEFGSVEIYRSRWMDVFREHRFASFGDF